MAISEDQWVSARDAAAVLSSNTDHDVSDEYIRTLARLGKIKSRVKNKRAKEYSLADVSQYRVRPLRTDRTRPRPSKWRERARLEDQELLRERLLKEREQLDKALAALS